MTFEILIRKGTCNKKQEESKSGLFVPNTSLIVPKSGLCTLDCHKCKSQEPKQETEEKKDEEN